MTLKNEPSMRSMGGIADPLLNAVAAGLVQRMEVVHVIDDLLAGQSPEPDVAAYGETPAAASRAERDARDHRVTMAREPFEHPDRIFAVFGLAQHLAVQDDDGVCCQQDFVFRERPGISAALELREVAGHLRRGQRRGIDLLAVVPGGRFVRQPALGEQLLPSR